MEKASEAGSIFLVVLILYAILHFAPIVKEATMQNFDVEIFNDFGESYKLEEQGPNFIFDSDTIKLRIKNQKTGEPVQGVQVTASWIAEKRLENLQNLQRKGPYRIMPEYTSRYTYNVSRAEGIAIIKKPNSVEQFAGVSISLTKGGYHELQITLLTDEWITWWNNLTEQ